MESRAPAHVGGDQYTVTPYGSPAALCSAWLCAVRRGSRPPCVSRDPENFASVARPLGGHETSERTVLFFSSCSRSSNLEPGATSCAEESNPAGRFAHTLHRDPHRIVQNLLPDPHGCSIVAEKRLVWRFAGSLSRMIAERAESPYRHRFGPSRTTWPSTGKDRSSRRSR